MPANTHWSWTEAFGYLSADAGLVHSDDWSLAWRSVQSVLDELLPQERLETFNAELSRISDRLPDKVLAQGSGWGALERRRIERASEEDRIPQALLFDKQTMNADQAPWLALLEHGEMPVRDVQEDPGQYIIQPEWKLLLEKGLNGGRGDHWLSWLHLGIMSMEMFDESSAFSSWQRSMQLRPSAWALRNLAVIETRNGNIEAAADLLREAWNMGPQLVPLALEYADALLKAGKCDLLRTFLESMPYAVATHERMRLIKGRLALNNNDFEKVEEMLDYEFTNIGEGELTLSNLWFDLNEKRIAQAEDIPLDELLKSRIRQDFPPPGKIDFRMVRNDYEK